MKRKIKWNRLLFLFFIPVIIVLVFYLVSDKKEVESSKDIKKEIISSKEIENENTIYELLKNATIPLGHTRYVYGGGWNEQDTGAGIEALTIGESKNWESFYLEQDEYYQYENYNYQIHDGLDCSGYVGWVIYNTLCNENQENDGYVYKAEEMVYRLEEMGYGKTYTTIESYSPGDIMSTDNGHVYIVISGCEDGSVLLIHSSPPGVKISGTVDRNGNPESQAVRIAQETMKKYRSDWYEKYPDCTVDSSYLTDYVQFKWNDSTLKDPQNLKEKEAQEIINLLFS